MARKKNTDLKLSEIKKVAKQVQETEQYELENGSTITFYPIFPHTKIDSLLEEYQAKLKEGELENVSLTDKMSIYYTLFLCIKHFTHLGKELAGTFKQDLSAIDWLVDSGYFQVITNEVFPKSEIKKVFDRMTDIIANYQAAESMLGDIQTKYKEMQLKNKQTFNNFAKKKSLS